MQLTKYTHSCVRLDDGDRALVLDPGSFSEVETALDGAAAVLVTHEHADHIDVDRLTAAARKDPRLRIWAPAGVAATLGELGEQVVAVASGESFDAGGFTIRTYGGQHALIHPTIPVVANVGYLVNDTVYHPGDSLIVPTVPVSTLLAPVHAPWSKTGEVIDFLTSVRAPHVFQIHDGLLNERGLGFVEGHVTRLGAQHGSDFRHLKVSETVDV
ncbi:MAG: MBL fold metallo-hydrolase [Pseudonocardiales bacterium]|nr:MAG: MBL fold metallo-hydrolase [Pseudonocardiales bacterium]